MTPSDQLTLWALLGAATLAAVTGCGPGPMAPVPASEPVESPPPSNPDYDVRLTVAPVTPDSGMGGRPTCHDPVEIVYDLVVSTARDTLRLGYSGALVEEGWRLLRADPDVEVVQGRDWSYTRSEGDIVGRRPPYQAVRFSYQVVPDDCATNEYGLGARVFPEGPDYKYVDPEVWRRRIQEEARQGGDRSYPMDPDIRIPSPLPLPQRPPPPPPPADGAR